MQVTLTQSHSIICTGTEIRFRSRFIVLEKGGSLMITVEGHMKDQLSFAKQENLKRYFETWQAQPDGVLWELAG